ncbi:hypothetical protein GCM10009639_45390 [Kitasatospora putterlickiae]|uniref:Uncharacterized protein n=1 Tax=Kitasatospora putterlickiae TaxID=221725 RepID=A0ABN1YC68_9ACTN
MSKKHPRAATLADITAALPPVRYSHGVAAPSPAGRAEFVDDRGQRWRKVRGPLHPRLVKRLLATADAVIIGRNGGFAFDHITPADRPGIWPAVKDRLADLGESPAYGPFEFAAADGRTLLYLEEWC